MDFPSSWGGLLPLWIIGAPLLWGVVMMFTSPRARAHDARRGREPRPASAGAGAGATAYDRPVMQARALPASRL